MPESAMAEAAVFRVLQACHADPEVDDLPGEGGPDFLCCKGTADQFKVEATSFHPTKVTKDTCIKNVVPESMSGQAFGRLTTQIDQKAFDKTYQLEGIGMPGVLAIASAHFGALLVLDAMAAEDALISQPFWVHGSEEMSTDLASSLFLRLEDGRAVPKNPALSAILLLSVVADRSFLCGALNPSAEHRFNSARLWEIPFVYLKDWPVEKNRLRCEWTMGNQRTYEVPHAAIHGNG
jgi:hypothetical protein